MRQLEVVVDFSKNTEQPVLLDDLGIIDVDLGREQVQVGIQFPPLGNGIPHCKLKAKYIAGIGIDKAVEYAVLSCQHRIIRITRDQVVGILIISADQNTAIA